ncbi:MAG: glycosyltransferase family 9 protein, partial [Ignavibacteria bacterium]|nr:glycosyltransferase family 9 protein [Ignavibacteria bacterium]
DSLKSLIQLLVQNKLNIILIGGKEDAYLGNFILPECLVEDSLINLIGALTVSETICLLDKCDLLICNDSAPTHMGCLTNCKVLTIYGSTIPQFGFYPFREYDSVIQIENLYCKPCGIHGRVKCPEKHFKCMMDLKPEKVFYKAIEMLNLPIIK